ncbi:phosphomethylpyrimidine kinase family protein [Mycobacterium xenopi 3993]|nr:phosphomethylpyrimidine kinase family protein [Mycobacterium xenopi 3993]
MTYLPLPRRGATPRRVLTIAGSDSGGGAGLQADIRTCALLGVHALCAVTAVTVQNTVGVKGFHLVPDQVIAAQIDVVLHDIGFQAAKTGMLASPEIIAAVAAAWRDHSPDAPLVVDPVCASMHGDALLEPSGLETLRAELFPLATLVTPNLHEVRLLVGIEVVDAETQRKAASALHALGPDGRWSKAGTCDRRSPAQTCCSTAGSFTNSPRRASTPATTTALVTRCRRRWRARLRTATPSRTRLRSASGG